MTEEEVRRSAPDDDLDVIEGCKRGDAAACKALYDKYSGKVFGFARRFMRDEQHAEDVTQDVFLRVFRKLDGFRGESRFSTWLFRVTVNSCKNKRRSLERLQRFDPDRFQEGRAEFEGPPERHIDGRLLQRRIDRALERLTEEQRTVLLLKARGELSYREIGDLFGQSENQIRGKLYRARKAFRAALEEVSGPGSWAREEHAAMAP